MADTENIEERLENMALEICKLRWRTVALEAAFTTLWNFSFVATAGKSWRESTADLLGILDKTEQIVARTLQAADIAEETRARRLTALAEVMEEVRRTFSLLADAPLPPSRP